MRVCALILGAVLLPASVLAQRVSPYPQYRPASVSMAVPVRVVPPSACGTVGGCYYPQVYYPYQRYGLGYDSNYDRRWRPYDTSRAESLYRHLYGAGSYKRMYGDPHVPGCLAQQGGVPVVSPPNPRSYVNRNGTRVYRPQPYGLLAIGIQIGCF